MIKTLRIENYRCLRDVTIELEPLTVFVGANASGKSSVFAALHAAHTVAFSPSDFWARRNAPIVVHAIRDDGRQEHRGLNTGGGSPTFADCQIVQLELGKLREQVELTNLTRINPNGAGLANLFASLRRSDQGEVAATFCKLVPMFADVALRAVGGGRHWIVFQDRWRPDTWYLPHEVSDGSILLLTYLLLPYQSPPPNIIAIEEPERGLHPYLMDQLVQVLRKLSKGEVGPLPVQVLLATHSAGLLEFVVPEEVRFLHRSKESGETLVRTAPTDDPTWLTVMKAYDQSLGDLWLSGGLGGVPGA
jgi:predicted ATPase